MITKHTKVNGTASVWAVPTSEYERKNDPSVGMFRYEITERAWATGAVKVKEYDITLQVPAGINLLERAIATLEEERTRVLGEAQKKAMELEKEIQKLLLLGGPSNTSEGELILANEEVPEHPVPHMPMGNFDDDIPF